MILQNSIILILLLAALWVLYKKLTAAFKQEGNCSGSCGCSAAELNELRKNKLG